MVQLLRYEIDYVPSFVLLNTQGVMLDQPGWPMPLYPVCEATSFVFSLGT